MSNEFVDANVILCLLEDGPKAELAEVILGQGPRISVQVLNEVAEICRCKTGMSWDETGQFLAGIQALCPIESVTPQTHDVGRALAERYGFSVCNATIVASSLLAGCNILYTANMHSGLKVEGQLRLVNPFA